MTDKTLVYVAGPMRGHADFNYPAFHAATAVLRYNGYRVINPAETAGGAQDIPRRTFMAIDLGYVREADCLCLLPGWEESPGAVLEMQYAHALGKPAFEYDPEDGLGDRVYLTAVAVGFETETALGDTMGTTGSQDQGIVVDFSDVFGKGV